MSFQSATHVPILLALWPTAGTGLVISLVAGGCSLQRVGGMSPMRLQPQQFCGGDTMHASYDFLRTRTCPAGVDCTPFHPTMRISSTPELFPRQTITGYAGNVEFTASGDRIDVLFDIDRESLLIPTERFDGSGNRIFIQADVRDETRTATRQEPFTRGLQHEGMCMGSTPMYATATLPIPPEYSPLVGMGQLCNASPVPIVVTLTGDMPGTSSNMQRLGVGECLDTSGPGINHLRRTRTVQVAPEMPDPMARCTGVGPYRPPQSLATSVRMQCF